MICRLPRLLSVGLVCASVWSLARAEERVPSPASEPAFADVALPLSAIESAIGTRAPLSVKPVGTSSVVFKVDLDGEIDAAFRPEHRLNPRGHLAEVSAYRVGRLLGLHNVAPAVTREFPLADVKRWLISSYRERWPQIEPELVVRDGKIIGACVYWVPDLHELGIDTPDGIKRWARWLAQDGGPPEQGKLRGLAAQISDMLVFDYLIGNFDRFSGANAQGDQREEHVFLRDHNMAFFEPLRPQHHLRVITRLKRVQRFSRARIALLKGLDRARIEAALRREQTGDAAGLLTKGQISALLDRRTAILSYVSALIDRHGEHNVLTFE